jgi:hypothetical protein
MHDHLYEHQQTLDDNHLEKYASESGLNLTRFNHDMSSRGLLRYQFFLLHFSENSLTGRSDITMEWRDKRDTALQYRCHP